MSIKYVSIMYIFNYEKAGSVFYCKGEGFEYKSVGNVNEFTQSKKVPSLRLIKTIIKLLKGL